MRILAFLFVASSLQGQLTYQRLLNAPQDPGNWMTYSGRYSGWRYSDLNRINRENVKGL